MYYDAAAKAIMLFKHNCQGIIVVLKLKKYNFYKQNNQRKIEYHNLNDVSYEANE